MPTTTLFRLCEYQWCMAADIFLLGKAPFTVSSVKTVLALLRDFPDAALLEEYRACVHHHGGRLKQMRAFDNWVRKARFPLRRLEHFPYKSHIPADEAMDYLSSVQDGHKGRRVYDKARLAGYS